jgi:hypothetical protein
MKQSKKLKVVVTKYALTKGLFWLDVEQSDDRYVKEPGHHIGFFGRLGRDCFETADAAERYTKAKARLKIASLKRQIAQLEKQAAEPKWYASKA